MSNCKSCKRVVNGLRFSGVVVMVSMLLFQVYDGYLKYVNRKMTFISTTSSEDTITYPTITMCITMDNDFNGGVNSLNWMPPENYNFNFPISDFGVISDKSVVKIG